jgi:hypothetical protein
MGDNGNRNNEELQQGMHDTWLRDWQYFTTDDIMSSDLIEGDFQGLRLPRKVVDKIFSRNAKEWFGVFK